MAYHRGLRPRAQDGQHRGVGRLLRDREVEGEIAVVIGHLGRIGVRGKDGLQKLFRCAVLDGEVERRVRRRVAVLGGIGVQSQQLVDHVLGRFALEREVELHTKRRDGRGSQRIGARHLDRRPRARRV